MKSQGRLSMRGRAYRRVLPLEFLLIGDVDHPVADDEEGERGRKHDPRGRVDVRDAVYVPLDALAVLATAVRGLALPTLSAQTFFFLFNVGGEHFFCIFFI